MSEGSYPSLWISSMLLITQIIEIWSQFRQPIYHLWYKAMLKENRWSPFVSTSSLAQPIWPKLSELDRLCKLAGGSKRASKLFFIISALFWIINGCRNWLHLCPQIFLTWYWWSRWCDKAHTIGYQVRITSKKRRINVFLSSQVYVNWC